MAKPPLLTDEQLSAAVSELDGWEVVDGKLHKRYVFGDFVEAFGFMAAAALCAERADHHPEWSNVYKTVTVDLVTHESSGITERDSALAAEFDRCAGG